MCGGDVKVINCIEEPMVIEKIVTHVDRKDDSEIAVLILETFCTFPFEYPTRRGNGAWLIPVERQGPGDPLAVRSQRRVGRIALREA